MTRKSLKHALTEAGVSLDEAQTNKMLQAYNVLSVFPDVPPVFEHLRSNNHIKASVFSNGDPDMIHTTLSQSPDISPHKDLFKDVVLVEPTKKFKPTPVRLPSFPPAPPLLSEALSLSICYYSILRFSGTC